jgi:hypothetical protein
MPFFADLPKVSTGSVTSLNGSEGNSVTIPCTIDAIPAVTSVVWLKNGSVLDTSDDLKYGFVTVSSPSMTIQDLTSSDAGVYSCQATNTVGTGHSSNVSVVVTCK